MEDLTYCKNCHEQLPPYPGVGPRRVYCNKAECNAQGRSKKPTAHLKKHHWSKWSGALKILHHVQIEEVWTCQACGKDQPKQIPAYKFPFFGEYLRICSTCQHIVVQEGITDFSLLKDHNL